MKVLKKLKQLIEKNSALITVISTIIFSTLTIISSIHIANIQNKIQKEESSPMFFLEEDNEGTIKIINKGGKVSYFKFKRVTEIWITVNNRKISLDIYYSDKNRLFNTLPNIENESVWYYIPTIRDVFEEEIKELINDKIDEIYPDEIRTFIEVRDYYLLSCKDYENSYREFHYTINDNGLGEPYNYVEKDLSEENIVSAGGMTTHSFNNAEEFYNELEEVIADYLLYFRWYHR